MKEIRLHGIGGMGTVKAGELLVRAAVAAGKYGHSMPFFGFERQGAPVASYVRLGDQKIRAKNQVYSPDCVIIQDPSLLISTPVFEGLKKDSYVILNTRQEDPRDVVKSPNVRCLAYLDATAIALNLLGRPIPNTIMLGAFVRATGWVEKEGVERVVEEVFGAKNVEAFRLGYEEAKIVMFE